MARDPIGTNRVPFGARRPFDAPDPPSPGPGDIGLGGPSLPSRRIVDDDGPVLPPPGPPVVDNGLATSDPATDLDEFANIPDAFRLYRIDGQLYMVYDVPLGTGPPIPVAYTVTEEQLIDVKGVNSSQLGVTDITRAEFNGAGVIIAGDFTELDNPDENPLQFFYGHLEEQAILYPWLMDPEIMALTAAAHLEGRSLDAAELAGTEWWQTHNTDERSWLKLNSSDPTTALRLLEDNRLAVQGLLGQAGVGNFEDVSIDGIPLTTWLADKRTTGEWTDAYLNNQITILGDPTRENEIDINLSSALVGAGANLTTHRGRITDVRSLYNTWLGPALGNPADDVVEEWAAKMRRSPSAKDELTETLKDQRVALLPHNKDREVSYQAMAGPWRNLMSQTWGQTPDEIDPFFLEMMRKNDAIEAGKMLRGEGLRRGNQTVVAQAFKDMFGSFGGEIVRKL